MNEAAEALEFERAARIRDRLEAVKKIRERQKVVAARVQEQDVIALAQGPSNACFEVFRFQQGRLCDRESFLLSDIGEPKTARAEFLERYYSMRDRIPPRISLDGPAASMELIARWLSEKAGRKVTLSIPQRGEQKEIA